MIIHNRPKPFHLTVGLILVLFICQCSPRQYPNSKFSSCYPIHPYDTLSFRWADPADSTLNSLSKKYTVYSLMVANSAGLLPWLYNYEFEKKKFGTQPTALDRIKLIERREVILGRINLFRSQVASVAAELDCEGERAEQLGDYLNKINQKQTKNLTVASIVMGAIGGVASALLQGNDSKATAVVGGFGSAFLGLASLSSSQKITFNHPRNLLCDIWFAPEHSADFPVMVWNMLNHKVFSNERQFTVANNLRKRWEEFDGLKPGKKKVDKRLALLLGKGGEYKANELKLRANMINQLQATVKLIDQDIQGLLSEIAEEKK